ncbi:hypothetical protein GCM10010911_67420 [Paenibacillus nasutitermitis]|uniref:Uncharacterized protein n=1 Tax=Paenibacillus nasutitermitis TaxID=1652958 RepID=A0A916ZI52_9BACL|nr:hypothetical protein GCM10010911_67420 [Paenibacillus nasutitermitis]
MSTSYIYTKYIDNITIGDAFIKDFQVEIGNMVYGMVMHGIVGFNSLKTVGVKIDAGESE